MDADGKTTKTGTIDSVTFGATGPIFDIDGTDVPLGAILSVTSEPSTSTSTASTTPAP